MPGQLSPWWHFCYFWLGFCFTFLLSGLFGVKVGFFAGLLALIVTVAANHFASEQKAVLTHRDTAIIHGTYHHREKFSVGEWYRTFCSA